MITTAPHSARHGAELTFETLTSEPAQERVRPFEQTLIRVIDGIVVLAQDGAERLLGVGGEAIVAAGTPHRLASAGGEARILMGFRAAA
jgi:hypothetical protein